MSRDPLCVAQRYPEFNARMNTDIDDGFQADPAMWMDHDMEDAFVR